MSREGLLAKLSAEGINTLEDLVEQAIPEVGGFMLRSGGLRTIGSATSSDTDSAMFVGNWYALID